ncbi:MAG: starch synthase, partial [Chitinophagaceae bacterium]|nr:starch synthase [Chitinophagaceae bacterium]
HSKCVYTVGPETFTDNLGENFVKVAQISDVLKEKDLAAFADGSNLAMIRGGATWADAITFGEPDEQMHPSIIKDFGKVKGKKVLRHMGHDADLTDYLNLYNDLADN